MGCTYMTYVMYVYVCSEKAISDYQDGELHQPLQSLHSFLWMWMLKDARDKVDMTHVYH
jgi:hypothetical protein